jgi:hypothetical protein
MKILLQIITFKNVIMNMKFRAGAASHCGYGSATLVSTLVSVINVAVEK